MEYLTELGIPFTAINIRASEEALAFMRAEGHGTTPQMYVGKKLLVERGNAGLRELSKTDILERLEKLL